MNHLIFKKPWNVVKKKLQKKWSKLTEADLKEIEDDHSAVYERLDEYYGYTKERADKELNQL
jgi:hypothetical protein